MFSCHRVKIQLGKQPTVSELDMGQNFPTSQIKGLCIKVGRGQGDGDIGTRVWGLGTWGRETGDLRTSSMGCGDAWDGDAGTSKTGMQGTRDVNDYRKSRRLSLIHI